MIDIAVRVTLNGFNRLMVNLGDFVRFRAVDIAGETIIRDIVDKTARGAAADGSTWKGYSKAYKKKREAAGLRTDIVDLRATQSGNSLLSRLQVRRGMVTVDQAMEVIAQGLQGQGRQFLATGLDTVQKIEQIEAREIERLRS